MQGSNAATQELARREFKKRQRLALLKPQPLQSDEAVKVSLQRHLEQEENHAEIMQGIQEQTAAIEQAAENRVKAIEKTAKAQLNQLDKVMRAQAEALDKAVTAQCATVAESLATVCESMQQSHQESMAQISMQVMAILEKVNEPKPRPIAYDIERDRTTHLMDQVIPIYENED